MADTPGDTVLREFAALVQRNLRPQDLFGRIGGEEFARPARHRGQPRPADRRAPAHPAARTPVQAGTAALQVTLQRRTPSTRRGQATARPAAQPGAPTRPGGPTPRSTRPEGHAGATSARGIPGAGLKTQPGRSAAHPWGL